MVTGPGDELAASAAGRGRLRVSDAEREQVIGTLKAAFVRGTLAKDEFDLRVSQAFASRTYAELTAVTAGTCTKIQKGADLHADRQFLRALSRHTGWQADDYSHHRDRKSTRL